VTTCSVCGKQFSPDKFHLRQKYCGTQCRNTARQRYKKAYNRVWRRLTPDYMKNYRKKKNTNTPFPNREQGKAK